MEVQCYGGDCGGRGGDKRVIENAWPIGKGMVVLGNCSFWLDIADVFHNGQFD